MILYVYSFVTPDQDPMNYSMAEEIAHSIIHGIGLVLAFVGLGILIEHAAVFGSVRHVVSCGIYGATLILLYTSSTLYHSIQNQHAKSVLRVLDHSSIYLLIAGSYTPFTLVNLRGVWGWSLFGFVWVLAMFGIVLQLTPLRRLSYLRLILYLTMGWAVVVAIKQLAASIPANALALLVAGGVAYTAGVIFYLWKRLPYHHAIWHVFVLSGSILQFFAVLLSVKSSGA